MNSTLLSEAFVPRISVTFSDGFEANGPSESFDMDVAPFLLASVADDMSGGSQWVLALLYAEADAHDFIGEVDFGDLVEWARANDQVGLAELASYVAGKNSMLSGASERYNVLPTKVDGTALRQFALTQLSEVEVVGLRAGGWLEAHESIRPAPSASAPRGFA